MKNDSLTSERFQAILEAYGAEPRRWPEGEREAAMAFMAEHADVAAAWLEAARETDTLLDSLKVADAIRAASLTSARQGLRHDLRTRILDDIQAQMAPPAVVLHVPSGAARAFRRRPVVWAAGLGLAACLAGALLGVNISMMSLADVRAQSVLEQTQMIDAEAQP